MLRAAYYDAEPQTGDMQWTNQELGLILRYTNEPGSFAKVRINKALGL